MKQIAGFIPPQVTAKTTPAEYEDSLVDAARPATLPYDTRSTKGIPNPKLQNIMALQRLFAGSNELQLAARLRAAMMQLIPLGIEKVVGERVTLLDEEREWPLSLLRYGNVTEPGRVVMERFWTYEAYLTVAYLAFTTADDGTVQMHALNPSRVYRITGPKGVVKYGYYDPANPNAAPVEYDHNQVIEFSRSGMSDETHGLTLPTSELALQVQIDQQASAGIQSKQKNQQQIYGVISTDEDRQIKEGAMKRRKSSNSLPYLFLKKDETYKEVNLVQKDGLEADKIAQDMALEKLFAFIGVPLSVREPSGYDPDVVRLAVASMLMHTCIPAMQKFVALVTHKMCLPVPAAANRSVTVQANKIPQLASYFVDMTRASVAELNSGKSSINEQREVGGYDPIRLPDEVKEFEWALDTPVTIVKLWGEKQKAEEAAKASAGRPGTGTGASESLPMPGSQGGRDRRASGEGKLIDSTGGK